VAVAVSHAPAFQRSESRPFLDAVKAILRHTPLYLTLALVIGIHVPMLDYYFFGDDFLVLGDIRAQPFHEYMRDVVLVQDLTPNWRPLTMAVYYAEFELFGFDALAWRAVNLGFHVATVALLYVLVLSITRRVFVASAAALIFGVSASAVHTVTYITAFPHVLSEFLLVAALLSLHLYVRSDERRAGWYWLAFLLYVAGFLANEGGVVIGAVMLLYYALATLPKRRDVLDFTIKAVPFALAGAFLVGGLSGCGCQGVERDFYTIGWHIPRETWVYMARLAYPVGQIQIEPSALEWTVGSIVAGAALFFLISGPNLARIAAIGMVLALMPYAPGKIWTATRYTYMALPFFAILVAIAAGLVHHYVVRLNRPVAHVLAAAALFAVGGLYAWQTTIQTDDFLDDTARWELLATELQAQYESLPAGTTLYVIDDEGLWTNPFWQPTWLRSVGRALYGEDVAVRAIPSWALPPLLETLDGGGYFVQYEDGHLRQVSPSSVTSEPDQ
jgi:hypothetical protein